MVSTPLKFLRKYFHVALAKSAYYLVIKQRYLIYPWKNFCISFENREKHKNSVQWIFPRLRYGSEPSSRDHKCDQMITIHKAFYKDFCKSFCYIWAFAHFTYYLKHHCECVQKMQHERTRWEIKIARGKAKCCYLETYPQVLYYLYTWAQLVL